MSGDQIVSPALAAARAADEQMLVCLGQGKSFLLEAGAGAGKTYSLVETLRYLIAKQGPTLRRLNQHIACITYTNVATAVINSRIDGNPLVLTETIHAFCWSLLKGFQSSLRNMVPELETWKERFAASGPIGNRKVDYDLGHRRITDEIVSLHHDDVLALMIDHLPIEKFRNLLTTKYPFILIDEYQDTSLGVMNAIKGHLLGRPNRGHRTICSKSYAKRGHWAGLLARRFAGRRVVAASHSTAPAVFRHAGPHSRT